MKVNALSSSSRAFSDAISKPRTTSLGCMPMTSRLTARLRSSPAKMRTKLVLSPCSASWACEAPTSSLAAGWMTSISRMMVAASDVTKSRPRWLMISLFLPASRAKRGRTEERRFFSTVDT